MPGETGLALYYRQGCHLCEDMWRHLQEIRRQRPFALREIDVDSDPCLSRQYGQRVPVLTGNGRELCHYYLDPVALGAFLDQQDSQPAGV